MLVAGPASPWCRRSEATPFGIETRGIHYPTETIPLLHAALKVPDALFGMLDHAWESSGTKGGAARSSGA